MTTSEKIESAFERGDWAAADREVSRALAAEPDDHWLWERRSAAQYELRRYDDALSSANHALSLMPGCALTLWDKAGALDMLGRESEAVAIWRELAGRNTSEMAHGECGEGLRWARSLQNDCRYRIGLALSEAGRRAEARTWLHRHLSARAPGIPSLYPIRDVRRLLHSIESAPRRAAGA